MLESQIQKKIIQRLEAAGWFVTKLIQTSTNGIPDLLIIRQGVVMFIEVKNEKGDVSPLQKIRINQIYHSGINTIIARSESDIFHLVK